MTETFWKKSIIEKPSDGRDLTCHASAWDFYNGDDFRIKQCTEVKLKDFETVHHEMGHIAYFQLYKDQPVVFRGGANPGFHEAVGDSLALSVVTPKHLKKIGLLDEVVDNEKQDINYLMSMALTKIAFLPFGYMMDQYRWRLFSGEIKTKDLNCEWWKLRQTIQGVAPPVDRTELDFDPGAKYHIPGDVPYIRYFFSYVLQFQLYQSMCELAGEYQKKSTLGAYKPLYRCDIYQSKEAGHPLSEMLKLGISVPWPDALEKMTGTRELSAMPLREYFSTLEEWLKQENKKSGNFVGWKIPTDTCTSPPTSPPTRISGSSWLVPSLLSLLVLLFSYLVN